MEGVDKWVAIEAFIIILCLAFSCFLAFKEPGPVNKNRKPRAPARRLSARASTPHTPASAPHAPKKAEAKTIPSAPMPEAFVQETPPVPPPPKGCQEASPRASLNYTPKPPHPKKTAHAGAAKGGASRSIAIDVETTGIGPEHRIITIAAHRMCFLEPTGESLYLIFNPERNSHPMAAKIHGWNDWVTRFQPFFFEHAAELAEFLSWGDTWIFHNASFDVSFLEREFGRACVPMPSRGKEFFCTMLAARRRWPGQRASLDACAARIGARREGKHHDAFEDAFLALSLYRFFHGATELPDNGGIAIMPQNYRRAGPRPKGRLPAREP